MPESRSQQPITYGQIVNYEEIDPFKISAQQAAATTANNLHQFGYDELEASRGESAFVWDEGDKHRAGVMEGLGTKNLVADAVDALNPEKPSFYRAIAQDSLAMIVNDLAVCGARPQLFWAHIAAGNSKWFTDRRRAEAFNQGCAAVCNELGITWAGGESPTLRDVVEKDAVEISGYVLGEIKPKERYVSGAELEEGDAIILIESSGIHANGLSAARELSNSLTEGYNTLLPDGTTYGETLLKPTNLYVHAVNALLDHKLPIKRFENITGHGWRKLMRAKEPATYRMHALPPALLIFDFLQKHLGVDDREMFENYNQGAGFAVYAHPSAVDDTISVINETGKKAWHAGTVEAGPKQVVIEPKNLVISGERLKVR